ncbi:hypothetical protein DFP72DRAFT_863293 [Ephemerocybe angulata]|uniref:Uncharacterized protein n=1 Tax=Ephemerocybe angulata TaxID=980116 RepID=A0A8H6H5Z9_9AGAR|nr:hypothetical protein DFP72DRAFT_863293 [Tulosesus angulatus]
MHWIDGITQDEALKMVRNATIDDLQHWAAALPPEMVPKFHDEIGENYAAEPFCLRLCLLVWIASDFTQIPKALQLKAHLASSVARCMAFVGLRFPGFCLICLFADPFWPTGLVEIPTCDLDTWLDGCWVIGGQRRVIFNGKERFFIFHEFTVVEWVS